MFFFFFSSRRRHTRSYGDWSSDVCSSDLPMSLGEQLSWVQARTERPVGVGFFAFDLPARTGELELAARRAPVVDVFWGDPDAAVLERIHAGGAIAFGQ